jgi:hypothetical protein
MSKKSLFDPVTGKLDMEELYRRCSPIPRPPQPKVVTVRGEVVREAKVLVSEDDPNAVAKRTMRTEGRVRPVVGERAFGSGRARGEEGVVGIDPAYRHYPTVVQVRIADPDWFEPRSGAGVARSAYDPYARDDRDSCNKFPGDSDYRG